MAGVGWASQLGPNLAEKSSARDVGKELAALRHVQRCSAVARLPCLWLPIGVDPLTRWVKAIEAV